MKKLIKNSEIKTILIKSILNEDLIRDFLYLSKDQNTSTLIVENNELSVESIKNSNLVVDLNNEIKNIHGFNKRKYEVIPSGNGKVKIQSNNIPSKGKKLFNNFVDPNSKLNEYKTTFKEVFIPIINKPNQAFSIYTRNGSAIDHALSFPQIILGDGQSVNTSIYKKNELNHVYKHAQKVINYNEMNKFNYLGKKSFVNFKLPRAKQINNHNLLKLELSETKHKSSLSSVHEKFLSEFSSVNYSFHKILWTEYHDNILNNKKLAERNPKLNEYIRVINNVYNQIDKNLTIPYSSAIGNMSPINTTIDNNKVFIKDLSKFKSAPLGFDLCDFVFNTAKQKSTIDIIKLLHKKYRLIYLNRNLNNQEIETCIKLYLIGKLSYEIALNTFKNQKPDKQDRAKLNLLKEALSHYVTSKNHKQDFTNHLYSFINGQPYVKIDNSKSNHINLILDKRLVRLIIRFCKYHELTCDVNKSIRFKSSIIDITLKNDEKIRINCITSISYKSTAIKLIDKILLRKEININGIQEPHWMDYFEYIFVSNQLNLNPFTEIDVKRFKNIFSSNYSEREKLFNYLLSKYDISANNVSSLFILNSSMRSKLLTYHKSTITGITRIKNIAFNISDNAARLSYRITKSLKKKNISYDNLNNNVGIKNQNNTLRFPTNRELDHQKELENVA